jgi:hypothetical protein
MHHLLIAFASGDPRSGASDACERTQREKECALNPGECCFSRLATHETANCSGVIEQGTLVGSEDCLALEVSSPS